MVGRPARELEQALESQRRLSPDDAIGYVRGDAAFHLALGRAPGNQRLERSMTEVQGDSMDLIVARIRAHGLPTDLLGPILPTLTRLGAVPLAPSASGSLAVVDGEVPAARVHALMAQLPGLTRGEGVLETAFDHYAPVRGEPPQRR